MTEKYFFGLPPEIQEKLIISLELDDILAICRILHYPRKLFFEAILIVKDLLDQKKYQINDPAVKKIVILIVNKLVQDEIKHLSKYNKRCCHPEIIQFRADADSTEEFNSAYQSLARVLTLRSLHEMDRIAPNSVRLKNKLIFASFFSLFALMAISSYPLFLFVFVCTAKLFMSKSLMLILYSVGLSLLYYGLIYLVKNSYDKCFDKRKQHNLRTQAFYHQTGNINRLSSATKNAGFFSYEQAARRALNHMHYSLSLIKP
jgi:hypothetical protein